MFIQNNLQDPKMIWGAIIVVVAIAIIVLVIAATVLSRRRRSRQLMETDELAAGERRNRFLTAADSLPFSADPGETAQAIASIFRDYLSIRVLALFAGASDGKQLENLLLRNQDSDEHSAAPFRLLPTLISADVLDAYERPQFVPLGQFAAGPETMQPPANMDTGALIDPGARSAYEADVDLANTQASKSRESTAANMHHSDSIAVLPWKGSLNWHGLIVAGSEGQMDLNDLSVVYEFQGPISSRLAVALELDQKSAGISAASQQQSRIVDFIRSMPTLLPVESHFPEVLRLVAELLAADSAAYWRVDPQTRTLNMVAADRLNAGDFLPVPIGRGFCGTVVESLTLVIEDALSDPRCLFPGQYREARIASYLGVPVFSASEVTGVLEVHTTLPHKWDESNSAALKIAAASIENKNSRGNTGPLGLRAETAYIALSEALQGLGSRKELLEAAVEVVGHAVGASRTLILQPDDSAAASVPTYSVRYEYCAEKTAPALGRQFATEVLWRAIDAGPDSKPVVIDDSAKDSLLPATMAAELGVLSEVAVPIKAGTESPWLLWVHRCDYQRPWSRDEVAFVERVAHQIAIARDNIESLERANTEAEAARAAMQEAEEAAKEALARESTLQGRIAELEGSLAEARQLSEKVSMAGESETLLTVEQSQRLRADHERATKAAQQLLDVNRLKSEFIVNAGRELDASLQSLLGQAELLEQGSYGVLTAQQLEAVRGIYAWGRRLKTDVDWLIDYGSARSRRLEPGGGEGEQS
jgi:GAF domain-containing protein